MIWDGILKDLAAPLVALIGVGVTAILPSEALDI
jgi:hypothetical protein